MKRHESREQALLFLFESTFRANPAEKILELAVLLRDEKISNFSKELFLGTLDNLDEVDLILEKHLKRWRKSRLTKMVLSILRLAIFEMIHYGTPENIAIDEAVKLAQDYASQEDALYINGVLGGISKKISKES